MSKDFLTQFFSNAVSFSAYTSFSTSHAEKMFFFWGGMTCQENSHMPNPKIKIQQNAGFCMLMVGDLNPGQIPVNSHRRELVGVLTWGV